MSFVVITKTWKDVPERRDTNAHFPDDYPAEAISYSKLTKEQCEHRHPGCKVMSFDEYQGYSNCMSEWMEPALRKAYESNGQVSKIKSRGWWARLRNKDA